MPTPAIYDIGLDDDGDLPVVCRHITGLDLVVQRVTRRLRTFYGEYLADRRVGLPYLAWAQQKPPRTDAIGAVIRATIAATTGVVRVSDWSGTFDVATRALTFTGTIHTSFGDVSATILPFGTPGTGNRNAVFSLLVTPSHIVRR